MQAPEVASRGVDEALVDAARAAAFRALLDTRSPVTVDALAHAVGCDATRARAALHELERRGLARTDDSGDVVGAYGLSVVPSRDEIEVEGRRYWTWCAKTSLGVLAAIGKGGEISSSDPASGRGLRLSFEGSRPRASNLAVFWPSEEMRSSCSSIVDDFCPNISFFEDAGAAERWAADNDVPGEVLSVEEAAERSAGQWRPLVQSR